jgi:adenosine deaminase
MEQWLTDLPKIDLHVHLDGSLRLDTVLELAAALPEDQRFPESVDLEAAVTPSGRTSLEEYLQAFDYTVPLLQTPEALERAAFELTEDAARENTMYIEIRFAPLLHTEQGLKPREVVQAVLRGLAAAEDAYPIRTGLLLTALKQEPTERSMEVAQLTAQFKGRGVVGFDLAGPERLYPPLLHRQVIGFAQSAGVHVTIHAGEGCCPEQVREAVDLGAERIGHGVYLCRDPETERRVAEERIPLEICPTSNVQISGFVETYADHPLGRYLELGIPITLNTDNRLMSRIDLTFEFTQVADAFALDKPALAQLVANSIDAAFTDEKTKTSLRQELDDYLRRTGVFVP